MVGGSGGVGVDGGGGVGGGVGAGGLAGLMAGTVGGISARAASLAYCRQPPTFSTASLANRHALLLGSEKFSNF